MRDFSQDVEHVVNAGVRTLFYDGDAVSQSLGSSIALCDLIIISRIYLSVTWAYNLWCVFFQYIKTKVKLTYSRLTPLTRPFRKYIINRTSKILLFPGKPLVFTKAQAPFHIFVSSVLATEYQHTG